jgi:hypothetical protein
MVGIRVVADEEAQGIVIHTAPHHGLSFKELELSCPFWSGDLKFCDPLNGFLLAIGQSTLLEELQGVVVRSLGTAGIVVF